MRLSLLSCLLFLTACALAKPATEQWQVSVPGTLQRFQVTELGPILATTDSGLVGISETGSVAWQQIGIGSSAELDPVPGSPFYRVTTNDNLYLLDPVSGRIVFDAAGAGIGDVDNFWFLFNADAALIKGKSNLRAEATTALVDLTTGLPKWQQPLDLGRVLAVELIGEELVLIVTLFDIYGIDLESGDIRWQSPTDPSLKMSGSAALNGFMKRLAEELTQKDAISVHSHLVPGSSELYLGVGSEATAHYIRMDASTGDRLWTEVRQNLYPGIPTRIDEGLLTTPTWKARTTHVLGANKVNLLDASTGKGQWGKKSRGLPIKGGVVGVFEASSGLLIATYNGKKSFVYALDTKAGAFRWKKPLTIDSELLVIHEAPAGVFGFTREGINLLDVGSGKLAWKKAVRATPALTVARGDDILAWDQKERTLKKIDMNTGKVSNWGSKLKFEGKEQPTQLEVFADSVLVTSSQNMALIDNTGKTIYQKYFPAPRRNAWLRALYYAQGIRAAIISAQSYAVTGSLIGASLTPEYQDVDPAAKSVVAGIGTAYGELAEEAQGVAAESFRRANERFRATADTSDYRIVMARQDKEVVLQYVRKGDGNVIATVNLDGDKTPDYAVDAVTGTIYLRSGNSISAYRP